MNKKHRKREQNPKPRLKWHRATVFEDKFHDADKKAARSTWLTKEIQDEIDEWEEWV